MNAKTLTLLTGHFTRTIGMSQNSCSRAICWVNDDSKSVDRNSDMLGSTLSANVSSWFSDCIWILEPEADFVVGVGAVYTESFDNVDTEPMDTAMRPGSVCDDGSMGISFCPAKHRLKPS
jgi:hypothetical protein